jgi:hypothetical protein
MQAGLHLIDLGRAEKASKALRDWEMEQLKATLAEGRFEVEYSR